MTARKYHIIPNRYVTIKRPYNTIKDHTRQYKTMKYHKRPYKTTMANQGHARSFLQLQGHRWPWKHKTMVLSLWTPFCIIFCSIWNILLMISANNKNNNKPSFRTFEHSSRSKMSMLRALFCLFLLFLPVANAYNDSLDTSSTVGQNQVNLFGNCFLLKNAQEYPLIVTFLHFWVFLIFLNFLCTLRLFYHYKYARISQKLLYLIPPPMAAVAFCLRAFLWSQW